MRTSFRAALTHYAQGLLMGSADIIPGVSGGTMALIVGIYERLIDAISHLFSAALWLARFQFANVRLALSQVSWGLIVPLGLGIATALVVGARLIPHLLETYPAPMRGLFFGLIAGSLAIPWRRIGRTTPGLVGLALLGAVGAFFLVGLPPATVDDPALPVVFGAAMIAICAMILPGVSGAFFLLVMGLYEPTLRAVNDRNVLYVLVFMAGAALGLGLFSKLLDWLLEHRHDATMAVLVGLMAGSLRALWPWLADDRTLLWPDPADPVAPVLLLGVGGFVFVSVLAWWGQRVEALRAG